MQQQTEPDGLFVSREEEKHFEKYLIVSACPVAAAPMLRELFRKSKLVFASG
jgi:hypothetical protein